MKEDHERVTKLLTDTVTLLCKNGLSYDNELRIQGLLGITIDGNEVFLVSINDFFNCSSSSSPVPVPLSSDAAGSSQSRKRSRDDVVDLTHLVETPQVHSDVQPSQLPSSISPLRRGAQNRPRSAGSVSQARNRSVTPSSSNLSINHHSHLLARQAPFQTVMTTGHPNTSTGRRNSAEHLMSANSQHDNALALVDPSVVHPGQRPRAGYMHSVRNLALACDRQLAPCCCHPAHQRRVLPVAGSSGWTGVEQQHSMQLRLRHQGAASAAAPGNSDTVGRPRTDHFVFSPHSGRQAVPHSVCFQRSEVNSSHYAYANTAVSGVVGPPPVLSRQPYCDVTRPVYHDRPYYVGNMPQLYAAAMQERQLVDRTTMQPSAQRQSFNPALISHPHGYFPHQSTSVSQQAHTVANPHSLSSVTLCSTSTSPTSCVTSSPLVKPPSSPVQPGRRVRPRQVEHIDLCDDDDDDDTANNGFRIPVSSIVIQPDNVDTLTAADEAERSNMVSMNTTDSSVSEFEPAPEDSFSGTSLPPLTRILEIVPLDDGSEDATKNVGQSASASVVVVASEPSDSGRNCASIHDGLQLSAAPSDISRDSLSMFPDSFNESARLSADEVMQMAELCFDAEDSAQM